MRFELDERLRDPHPNALTQFVGGPLDGQFHPVRLCAETDVMVIVQEDLPTIFSFRYYAQFYKRAERYLYRAWHWNGCDTEEELVRATRAAYAGEPLTNAQLCV